MIDKGMYEQKKQLASELWDKYSKAAEELRSYARENTPLPENIYWKAKKMKHYYKLTSISEVFEGGENNSNYNADFLSMDNDEYRLNKVWAVCKTYIEESCIPITVEEWNEALKECGNKIMENMVTVSEG